MRSIVTGLILTVLAAPAAAVSLPYTYLGKPMNCIGFASSCVTQVANPVPLTASITLLYDFNKASTSDQTVYASGASGLEFTSWSITYGGLTLSSAHNDTLSPTSSLTYNNGVIRTWNINASNSDGSIVFNIAPHTDYTTINGDTVIGRSLGSWTVGNGGAVGGVPEPASWALLLTGFAFTGTAMRRRTGRRTVSA